MSDVPEQDVPVIETVVPAWYIQEGDRPEPMDAARSYRDLKRERKALSNRDGDLLEQEKLFQPLLQEYAEAGLLSFKVDLKKQGGGTVSIFSEVYTSLTDKAKDENGDLDVDSVLAVFEKYNIEYLVKEKIDSRSLTSWFKKEIELPPPDVAAEDWELKSAEEKAQAKGLGDDLLSLLKISEPTKVKATGL